MWMFFVKRLLKKGRLFKYFIAVISFLFVTLVVLGLYVINQNTLLRVLVKNKSDKFLHDIESKASGPIEYYNKKYGGKVPTEEGSISGLRGNGLNLLLIGNIKTEGYVKELLQLYSDASEGKITEASDHLTLEAYLGAHSNEVGTYSGTLVPKSYIPFKNNTIMWGEPYGTLPGEALKLRNLNENVINGAPVGSGVFPFSDSGKLPYTINNINPVSGGRVYNESPSRDIGYFQIQRLMFNNTNNSNNVVPAKINGYNTSAGRGSDAYYLPDMISALDGEYSRMLDAYNLHSVDKQLTFGAYSIWHNGGSGVFDKSAPYGVAASYFKEPLPDSSDTSEEAESLRKDYAESVVEMPKSLLMAATDKQTQISGLGKDVTANRVTAVILMLTQGYYLTPKAYNNLISGSYSRHSLAAWNAINGTDIDSDELAEKLKPYVKTITEVNPDYDQDTVSNIYGQSVELNDNQYGTIWKLEDRTSPVYKNKKNGKNPRVLHYTNLITAGHMLGTMVNGRYIYAQSLAYAGVGIDPTDPSTYMSNIGEDTFNPSGGDFAKILEKIGVHDINPKAYSMLEWGYNHSGFYYYLGGYGLPISQENFRTHYAGISLPGNTKSYFFNYLYKKKDGSPADETTPNSELANYGKFLFDCSTLTGLSYNNTIGKDGPKAPTLSLDQLNDDTVLETVDDWNDMRPGDLLVKSGKSGHVYFFLAKQTDSNGTTLDQSDTKTEDSAKRTADLGKIWCLEASTSEQMVGIRVNRMPSKSEYTLRRFKELAN